MKAIVVSIAIVVGSLLGQVSAEDPNESLSTVEFKSERARQAQQTYNNVVWAACMRYQEEVTKAEEAYVRALKSGVAESAQGDDPDELARIADEIKRHRRADLQAGLVLYYNFDRAGERGEVADLSGSGNRGTVLGAAWTPEGAIGGAYTFDIRKKSNVIRIPDRDSLDVTRITVSAWIKTMDKDEHWNRVVDKHWQEGYTLSMGGKLHDKMLAGLVFFEVGGHSVGSDGSVADGKWHHLVGTYDGTVQRLYVDGKQQKKTENWSGDIPKNKHDLFIGNSMIKYETPEFTAFDGAIDEVRIYNRALSQREILQLYAQRQQYGQKK